MVKIKKQLISGLDQPPLIDSLYIVAHEAGNPNNTGADSLDNEIKYMSTHWDKGAKAYTSHFVGSGGRIVQLARTGKRQNGAGWPANGYTFAHVELARTKNKKTFKADYEAYIWILRDLADDAGLPKTLDAGGAGTKGIKSHDWIRQHLGGTTHTDPYGYLASHGISKSQFKHDVERGLGGYIPHDTKTGAVHIDKPKPKPKSNLIRKGDKGSKVKQLQKDLIKAGEKLPRYGADGDFGNETLDAVKAFQARHGLAVDGLWGDKSRAAMKKALAKPKPKPKSDGKAIVSYPGHYIRKGSRGKDVERIQRAVGLKEKDVDGIFGAGTEKAVKAYQRRHGLASDGIVGKLSWNVMF